jgi:PAS domain S-box-containing protein
VFQDQASGPGAPPGRADRWPRISQYLIAILALMLATLVRWALDPALGDHLPYVTYFVAVAFVAWRCPLGPSLFALAAGWWLSDFLFYSPRYIWYPHGNTPAHIVGAATYFMVGLSSIAVSEAMRHAQRRAARAHELLRVTFASIGDAVLATDMQGRVTSLNAVAESLTGWKAQEAAGRPLEDVFRIVNEDTREPVDNPVGKVLAEGIIVGLANHTVLIARDGTERPIDDSAAPIRDAEGKLVGAVLVFRDVTTQRKSERVLRVSEARKAAILDTALDCIVTIDHRGRIIEFNPACERTFGYSRAEVIGREMGELLVPPALRQQHRDGLARYISTGEAKVLNRRIELTAMRSDGAEFPVELAITRITGDGEPVFTGYLRDISDRKRAEERQRLLTDELNHRVKNTLTVIQSIAHQTARFTPDAEQFQQAFSARLMAMSRTHDLLTSGAWRGAELGALTELALAPYRGSNAGAIEIDGHKIVLPSDAAVSISLILHELATNATKYGALSQATGCISVRWRELHDPRSLVFEWSERGGPPVSKPTRQGFGTRLIEAMAAQLGGKVSLSHQVGGLSCRIEIPLSDAPADSASTDAP